MLNKSIYLEDGTCGKTDQLVFYPKNEPEQITEVERYNPYARETEYFAECVQSGAETEMVPSDDVIQVLRILAAVKQSLEEGQVVCL